MKWMVINSVLRFSESMRNYDIGQNVLLGCTPEMVVVKSQEMYKDVTIAT